MAVCINMKCIDRFMKDWKPKGFLSTVIGIAIAAVLCPEYVEQRPKTHYGNPTDPVVLKVRYKDLQSRQSMLFRFDKVKLYNYRHLRTPEIMYTKEQNRR